MSAARRIAKNSTFQAVAFAAEGLTEFILTLALARLAGVEELGQFSTLIILASLFAFISAFGLPSLLTREISRVRDDRGQIARIVNAAVGLVAVLSTIAALAMLVVGVASGYPTPLLRALILTAIALGLQSIAMVVSAAFRGIEALERSSAVTAVMEIAFMLLALAAILLDARIDGLMAMYVASRLAALVLAVAFYQARFGRLWPAFDRTSWRTLLSKGFPFSVNSIFSFTYSRADVVILSFLAGNVAVGFYVAAYSLTMRMNVIARTLTFALYPFLSLQFVKDTRSMLAYTSKGLYYLIIAGLLIATMLWMFGNELLLSLYGEAFADAAAALRLLAFAVPLRFIETMLATALDASNRSGMRAMAVAVTGVANCSLNLILIPTYQVMGAVYATLASEAIICAVFIWCLRDVAREIMDWRSLVGPGLGTALIVAGLMLFNGMSIWLSLTFSVLAYSMAIVVFDPSTTEPLRQIARRR